MNIHKFPVWPITIVVRQARASSPCVAYARSHLLPLTLCSVLATWNRALQCGQQRLVIFESFPPVQTGPGRRHPRWGSPELSLPVLVSMLSYDSPVLALHSSPRSTPNLSSFFLFFNLKVTSNPYLDAMTQKIRVQNPVVELDGDEMTRIIWKKIREEVSCTISRWIFTNHFI